MTLNEFMEFLEKCRPKYGSYKVMLNLDHTKSPEEFEVEVSKFFGERIISIVKGNRGL